MSGSSHLRPGYQSLLADARSSKIDIVVAEALDRVSRDQEHVAAFFKPMQFCGIRVVRPRVSCRAQSVRSERETQQAVTARKLQQIERQIDALVSALAEGMKSTSVIARLGLLEAERETLAGRVNLEPEPPVRMHPNLAGLYRRKVEALREALTDEETRTEALDILRTLIEAVLIDPMEGGYEIELVGEIANMLDVTEDAGNKKTARGRAALSTEDRRSVKLVAGA